MSRAPREKQKSIFGITFHKLDWLEWTAIVFTAWFFFYPKPYTFLFTVLLVIPILGLILNGVSRPSLASLISIDKSGDEEKYDIADFIEFPGLVIMVRVLMDFEYESFYSILKVGTITFVLLIVLLFVTHKKIEERRKGKFMLYAAVIGNIALYSYGATYGVNCVFDRSDPEVYETKVIDMSVYKGRKRTTYYIHVEPWGHHKDPERISVSKEQYDKIAIGEVVPVDYKEGLLGIPWYYIDR